MYQKLFDSAEKPGQTAQRSPGIFSSATATELSQWFRLLLSTSAFTCPFSYIAGSNADCRLLSANAAWEASTSRPKFQRAQSKCGFSPSQDERLRSAAVTYAENKKRTACRLSPDLCKLMDRRLGNSLARESSDSSMVVRLLLARISVSSDGNIIPSFRISVQSWRLLSVMWSNLRDWQQTGEQDTVS